MSDEKDIIAVNNSPAVPESTEEETTSTQEAKQGSEASSTQPEPETPAQKGGKLLGGVALLLSLIALVVGGYLWYQVDVQQRIEQTRNAADVSTSIKGLIQQVTGLEKQQNKLEARQGEIDSTIKGTLQQTVEPLKKSQAEIASSVQNLSSSVEKVYAELDRSLDSWALEEIEQLLRIANHSLSLSRDVNTAKAGLEFADRRLQELGNPKFTEVRRIIAEEIVQLQGVKSPDITGIALRLNSLSSAVDKLPLKDQPQRKIDGAAAVEGEKKLANRWVKAGREMLTDLQGLVRIQNVTEPAKPLLSPDERFYLFENLRLTLSSAQIALLKADTNTFRANLKRTNSWLQTYFKVEDSQINQALTDLRQMGDIELKPQLPDISASLNALQKIKMRAKSG